MVAASDEEEETARLLSSSPCPSCPSSPSYSPRRSSTATVRPSRSEPPYSCGWEEGSSSPLLQLRPAEKTFLAMSGLDSCDMAQVPDSIEVVRSILSDLEADPCLEETGHCTCTTQPQQGSLVVDVHQGAVQRCSKHTAERFPRCYSESHRQRSREGGDRQEQPAQLHNLDKIETVPGESGDRLRHFSESSVGAGKRRRATFSSELRQLRRSITQGRSQQLQEQGRDLEAPRDHPGSLETFGSEVRFDIWDEGSAGEAGEQYGESELGGGEGGAGQEEHEYQLPFDYVPHPLVTSLRTGLPPPGLPSSLSHSSSTTSMPICRICQLPSMEPANPLLSPCRCLGSIRFVHNPCLMKWLEVSSKKSSDPPGCELCQYQYIRHKKFVISNWLLPSCSSKDKVLHSVFMAAIAIMISCSIVTILCFKQNGDLQPRVGPNTELSASELMTLSCGVLFFLAFFVAMYVEVKAENTIYQLICKFFYMNHEWTIEEYDRRRDPAKQLDSP